MLIVQSLRLLVNIAGHRRRRSSCSTTLRASGEPFQDRESRARASGVVPARGGQRGRTSWSGRPRRPAPRTPRRAATERDRRVDQPEPRTEHRQGQRQPPERGRRRQPQQQRRPAAMKGPRRPPSRSSRAAESPPPPRSGESPLNIAAFMPNHGSLTSDVFAGSTPTSHLDAAAGRAGCSRHWENPFRDGESRARSE
jgi:hypothetical protein